MSDKQVTSVGLDSDVKDAVERSHENFSSRVNEWARQFYVHRKPPFDASLIEEIDAGLQEIESDTKELLDSIQAFRESLDELGEGIERLDGEDEESYSVEDAISWWRKQPWSMPLDPENPAIERWADRVGMDARELADRFSQVERDAKPASLSTLTDEQ